MTADARTVIVLFAVIVLLVGLQAAAAGYIAAQHPAEVSPAFTEHPTYDLNAVLNASHGPAADNDGVITASDGSLIRDASGKYAEPVTAGAVTTTSIPMQQGTSISDITVTVRSPDGEIKSITHIQDGV